MAKINVVEKSSGNTIAIEEAAFDANKHTRLAPTDPGDEAPVVGETAAERAAREKRNAAK